jgi:hypothetical protein
MRYRRIFFRAQYPEMYDSVDVTLTNPIIADSLQPPEVARTLVVARITPTPTQQFLNVKVVVVAMNHKRMLNNKQDKAFSKAYKDRHSTASFRSQGYGSIIVCKLSWRNRSKI